MENEKAYSIKPLKKHHFSQVKELGDLIFGDNYIADIGLERDWPLVTTNGISLVAMLHAKLAGARLTYPPGRWLHLSAFKMANPADWGIAPEDTAYFKLTMVHPDHQNRGLARKMAHTALESLKRMGAKAVVTHSWNESPDGGSRAFIDSLGFKETKRIKDFWKEFDYLCTGCNTRPCRCSAAEMVLKL